MAFGRLSDGRVVLASAIDDDDMVQLWDPATGSPLGLPLTGHSSEHSSLAFISLPDGSAVLAVRSGAQLYVWQQRDSDLIP